MNLFKNFGLSITLIIIFSVGLISGAVNKDQLVEVCKENKVCCGVFQLNEEVEAVDRMGLNKFWKVYNILEDKAVDYEKLNDIKHVEDSVLAGLVRSLDDPYSLYMTEKQNEEFREDLAGNFEGIGAELSMRDELVTVVSPLKDSPAIRAGLRPQDIIIEVDGREISGWSLYDVVKIIRGPKGEEVVLTVIRKEEKEPISIEIIRDVIELESVKYEVKDNSVGYISINQFGDKTVKEFYNSIKEAGEDDLEGIILDLRYNGGGYLEASVIIASPFLRAGELVTTIKSKDDQEHQMAFPFETSLKSLPMIVLVNRGSASASEIVAGALRDNKRAVLVGDKTFGKGTVQEVVPLNGNSSVRVTVAKWYTPSGININKEGITPDVVLPRTYDDIIDGKDVQLDKAIEIIREGDMGQFFGEKTSLTGSAVLTFNGSGELVTDEDE